VAFTSQGKLGSANTKTAGTSLVIDLDAGASIGDLVIVGVATDNGGTSAGDTTHLSVTDSQGNSYTRRQEKTETAGGAGDGVTGGLFGSVLTTALADTDTITVTSTNVVARGAVAERFTCSGTPTYVNSASSRGTGTSPSDGVAGQSSEDNVYVTVTAIEYKPGNYTEDTGDSFTALGEDGPTAGGNVSCVAVSLGYKTNATGNTETHDPTITSSDYVHAIGSWYDASSGYTLTIDNVGSYTLSGKDPTLTYDLVLALDAGSYTLSGKDPTLAVGRVLALDAGAYTLTGQDPTLTYDLVLALEAGSYTLSGQDPTLAQGRKFALDAGSYTLTGFDPGLAIGRKLALDLGSYTLTGQDPSLTVDLKLALDAGSYTLTGKDPTLTYTPVGDFTLTIDDVGSYTLTGQDPGLIYDRKLALNLGSYVITGQDATLTYTPVGGYTLTIDDVGAYVLSGQDPVLAYGRKLALDTGSYALTGQAAGLAYGRKLALDLGSYVLSGLNPALIADRKLVLEVGSYILTGLALTMTVSAAFTGTISLTLYERGTGKNLDSRLLASNLFSDRPISVTIEDKV
jgi:hypothetical protein